MGLIIQHPGYGADTVAGLGSQVLNGHSDDSFDSYRIKTFTLLDHYILFFFHLQPDFLLFPLEMYKKAAILADGGFLNFFSVRDYSSLA
jgi:hypothetical protein